MKIRSQGIFVTVLLMACATLVLYQAYKSTIDGYIASYFLSEPERILMVGDVMLARDVENQIREAEGAPFFDSIRPLHEKAHAVVVNFEASIPTTHVQTPNLTFQFSVDRALVTHMARANITHASLANNHADDFGASERTATAKTLTEEHIVPFGVPRGVASTSVTFIELEERTVAFIALEDVLAPLDTAEAVVAIEHAAAQSDFQVVFIHWGTEYELVHNARQESLARSFVSAGADAVVGHHPHVVQDIQRIDGAPVFYSLGNYIFDQYWDEHVQSGLAVSMGLIDAKLVFELVPIRIEKARPRPMTMDESRSFLDALARRSEERLRSDILRGVVE